MPLNRQQSVISLDPIDRKKKKGLIARLLVTRWSGGRRVIKSEPYGHYMFTGEQGGGKTSSYIWYAEKIAKKYKKRRIGLVKHDKCDELHKKCYLQKFDKPPIIRLYSNVDIGRHINKTKLFKTIDEFDPYANEIRIVLIDEIHTYFPKDGKNKETQQIRDDLIAVFSQLRKRNTFILSTAQVYGRLDKSLREQCLYMVTCRVNINKKLVNEFIPGDDIICDDLGRWAGNPKYILVHGLPKINYDTKKLIRE